MARYRKSRGRNRRFAKKHKHSRVKRGYTMARGGVRL